MQKDKYDRFDEENARIVQENDQAFIKWKEATIKKALDTGNRELFRATLEAKPVDSKKVQKARANIEMAKTARLRELRRRLEKQKKAGDIPADFDIYGYVYGK